jgi:hypothetical protein
MRTNAVISRRHIGHDRNDCPHGTHVAKCPQGIHANRFSSITQSTHGLDGIELFACAIPTLMVVAACL